MYGAHSLTIWFTGHRSSLAFVTSASHAALLTCLQSKSTGFAPNRDSAAFVRSTSGRISGGAGDKAVRSRAALMASEAKLDTSAAHLTAGAELFPARIFLQAVAQSVKVHIADPHFCW